MFNKIQKYILFCVMRTFILIFTYILMIISGLFYSTVSIQYFYTVVLLAFSIRKYSITL